MTSKEDASIIAQALGELVTGVRSMTMFDMALRGFKEACEAQDWQKAEKLRITAQETLDVWLDSIAAVHRKE